MTHYCLTWLPPSGEARPSPSWFSTMTEAILEAEFTNAMMDRAFRYRVDPVLTPCAKEEEPTDDYGDRCS